MLHQGDAIDADPVNECSHLDRSTIEPVGRAFQDCMDGWIVAVTASVNTA
jgi:hypothetical protein